MTVTLVLIKEAALSTIFPIARYVLPYTDPIFFTAIRTVMAGVLLVLFQHIFVKKKPGESWTHLFNQRLIMPTIGYILCGIIITNAAECWGLRYVPSAKAALIYCLSPFFSAIIGYYLYSETITVKKLLGMFVGMVGFLFIALFEAPREQSLSGIGFISWAEISLLIASVTCVIGWNSAKKIVRTTDLSPVTINGVPMIIGGILMIIASFFTERWSPVPVFNTTIFVKATVMALLFTNLIGYLAYAVLLRSYSTTLLIFASLLEPPIAGFLGSLFLNEPITWHFFASMALIFAGLYIFYMEELRGGDIITPRASSIDDI